MAVLGAGAVGRALATGWARAGRRVVLGSREPDSERMRAVVAETGAAGGALPADAAGQCDIAVVTVPGDQVPALCAALGTALSGRVTIDATNSMQPGATVLHHADDLAAAGALVYRAFNSTGWEQMANPLFGSLRSDMPYAGPDSPERAQVHELIEVLGFRGVWVGPGPAGFELVDAVGRLWLELVFRRGWDRRTGLRLLTREDEPGTV